MHITSGNVPRWSNAKGSNLKSKLQAVRHYTGELISPLPDQKGNKLIFVSEWREFPSAPCLAGGKKIDDSSRLDVAEIARVPDMFPRLFPFLVGLRTYQHPDKHGFIITYMYIGICG